MADDLLLPDQAERAPPDLTLNAEVHRICVVEGGYPQQWPRHRACPCCGTGELRPLFRKYQFGHDQCRDCAFVCVNPYPPEEVLTRLYAGAYYTNFREFYEAHHLRDAGGDSMTAAPAELLETMIESAAAGRQFGEWLEVGGGLGTVADLIRRRRPGWRVVLNEWNPRSTELAREIYGLEVVSSSADELRKADHRFDVISAVQVLEHIPDPFSFLIAYADLLKPGGIMVVIVPQFTYLNAMVSRAAAAVVAPPFHASLFRESNLKKVLGRIGAFDRVQTSQFGPPAFSLLHHYDTSDYWDTTIPSHGEPVPRSLQVKEYSDALAHGLNALGNADPLVAGHFAETDGRLYLMGLAHRGSGAPPPQQALRRRIAAFWGRRRNTRK